MFVDVLSLIAVSKKFNQEQQMVFDQASFQFFSDQSYALMGPSGIGKSTLLSMIAGIESTDHGSIQINGEKIKHGSVGIVCQQPSLIAELSVIENVMLHAIIQQKLNNQIKEHAQNLLYQVGLADKKNDFVHTLSGGQQQKVAILRSILHPPRFLLADEPTGNLDRASADQIMQILLYYQKKYTMGLIVSTHDIFIAQQCDKVVRIEHQKLTT